MNHSAQVHAIKPADTSETAARRRTEGHVVDCDGSRAVILAEVDPKCEYKENYWAVGMLISIWEGRNRVVGQTYKVENAGSVWEADGENRVLIHIELVGEITEGEGGKLSFSTGIANYPRMGSIAHRIRSGDLEAIYKTGAANTIKVGHLTQEARIDARIDLDKLLTRHFAVVGSTGVGKSTSVTLMLRKIIAERSDLRILILDPHNEFTAAFARESVVKDASNLSLPFWLFRFEELTEVIFRGQKGLEPEAELLRDMIAEAKERYNADETKGAAQLVRRTTGTGRSGFTADSPVPFRIIDLLKVLDERLGLLEGKHEKPLLKSLRDRIISITRDPRFDFMFGNANAGGDRMQPILSEIFRVPTNGKPICIVEMSGLPSEVVSSVVSVLCRMAFDLALASQGGIQTLVVCEEAHRYIPANSNLAFWPTRQAIARIAKEGRKYGVYLGIITQRPSELDQTIFSQCNTVFAMRLSNQADQKIIGGALTNGAQSTIGFLASIANREAIAFGEGLKTPMRLTFETIPKELLPGSHIYEMQEAVRAGKEVDFNAVIRRMRNADGSQKQEEQDIDLGILAEVMGTPQTAPQPGDPAHRQPPVQPQPAGMAAAPAAPAQQQAGGAFLRRPAHMQPGPDGLPRAAGQSPSQPHQPGAVAAPGYQRQPPAAGTAYQRPAAPPPPRPAAPETASGDQPRSANSLINAFRHRS